MCMSNCGTVCCTGHLEDTNVYAGFSNMIDEQIYQLQFEKIKLTEIQG